MKKLRFIAFSVLLALLADIVFVAVGPHEPVYRGMSLTEWLADYDYDHNNPAKNNRAENAIAAMRIPQWHPFVERLAEMLEKAGIHWQPNRPNRNLDEYFIAALTNQNDNVRAGAARAVEHYRTDSKTVAPWLSRSLRDPDEGVRFRVAKKWNSWT